MRRVLKIVAFTLAGIAGLLAILALAGLFVVQSPWFRDKIRDRIVSEAQRATGGRVEIGHFDLDWRTLTAGVRDFVIHGNEAPGQRPLFRADSVQVTLHILSLWKKRFDLQSVVVRRPQVNVIVYPDGSTNLPHPAREPSGRSPLETVLDLAIKRFHLVDGTVQVQLRRTPLNVLGEDLRAQIFYQTAPARYSGELSFRQLDVAPGKMKTLPFDLDAKFTVARNRLEVAGARLGLKESVIDLTGVMEDFAAPHGNFRYAAHIQMKDLPPDLNLEGLERLGTVSMEGNIALAGATPDVTGRLQAAGLVFAQRGILIRNIGAASDVVLRANRIEFNRLAVSALHGQALGRAELQDFRELKANVEVRGFLVDELSHLDGLPHAVWNGYISGPVELAAVVGKRREGDFKVHARVAITPAPGPNPLTGAIDMTYDRRSGRIDFLPSSIATRFTSAQFSGTLGRRLDVAAQCTDLHDVEPAIAMFAKGPPPPLPVKLINGAAKFKGVVIGTLNAPTVQGHAEATNFIFLDHKFDAADADVSVSRSGVTGQNAHARLRRMRASGFLQVGFRNWKPADTEPIAGSFTAQAPELQDLLAEFGQKVSVTGDLKATGTVGGTVGVPAIDAHVEACHVVAYGQPLDCAQGQVRYLPELLQITSGTVRAAASQLQASAAYEHRKNDWQQGRLKFQLASAGIHLGQLQAVQERSPGLEGRVEIQLAGEVTLAGTALRPGAINGWAAVRNLAVDREPLGSLLLNASTKGSSLNAKLEGELAGAKITGASDITLKDGYPVRGQVEFTALEFSTLVAKLGRSGTEGTLPFQGFVAGRLDFAGSTLDPQSWKALVQLPNLEIRPSSETVAVPKVQELTIRNSGMILVDLTPQGARLRQALLKAKDTSLMVTGGIGFGVRNPWDLRVQGAVNLALLRDFDRDISSAGAVSLDVSVRGALARPDVYGQVDLLDAAVNLANFPNGIDRANGRIFLYRDRAILDHLTAETGGGKLSIGGFVGFGGVPNFHLTAQANDVRVRYPEGVSSTLNATLGFTGTVDRSVLSGEVTITRVGFNPRSDLGSLLAASTQPVRTPARPGRFEQGVHFDIHIVTAPQVRLETNLSRDIQAEANLRLRGDPIRPILLGNILINQGEVVFYGNRYTIDSGQIVFANASKIEPVVNLDLETRARGIDITLHVSGPADKLNLSYRSDPPMQFSDLVGLLATGREPSTTPGLVGAARPASQSWEQAGASAILSQAIANPIAGRLQRFFGVSRLKIDPQITGVTTNNAAARVTLEQQVTNNWTFTYITDLSRAQATTLRVEWDFTRNWSFVALREENGLTGIDFLYRKQFK